MRLTLTIHTSKKSKMGGWVDARIGKPPTKLSGAPWSEMGHSTLERLGSLVGRGGGVGLDGWLVFLSGSAWKWHACHFRRVAMVS